jgi:hypothetical protein
MTSGCASIVENNAALHVQLQKTTYFKGDNYKLEYFSILIDTKASEELPASIFREKTLSTYLHGVRSQEIVIKQIHVFPILFP